MDGNAAITFLNALWTSQMMFVIWLTPFTLVMLYAMRTRSAAAFLTALSVLPFLFYYCWAMTGLWSVHEVATAFNRSAQFVSAFVVTVLIIGFFYGRHR